MAFKSRLNSDAVARYINVDVLKETDVLKRLREETAHLPSGRMQISPDQGAFLSLLTRLMGVRRAIEIGTFTGYSSICIASALPPDGKLTCCDVSDEWTGIARRFWKQAGVENRIDLKLAPAVQTLDQLLASGAAGSIDLIFIDADKESYPAYYERSLELLRPNGLILLDNMLDGGKETDPTRFDPVTGPRHALTMQIREDARVEMMLAMVGGGLLMARKR